MFAMGKPKHKELSLKEEVLLINDSWAESRKAARWKNPGKV